MGGQNNEKYLTVRVGSSSNFRQSRVCASFQNSQTHRQPDLVRSDKS